MKYNFDPDEVANRVIKSFIGEIWHCEQTEIQFVETDFE